MLKPVLVYIPFVSFEAFTIADLDGHLERYITQIYTYSERDWDILL
jgi:hypothetical protein